MKSNEYVDFTRYILDIDKEIAWLNRMASEGYRLVSKKWCTYYFELCEKNQYMYQVEKRRRGLHAEDKQYVDFLEEMGIRLVDHTMGYYYFEKENDGRPFQIYTDFQSIKAHYKRVMTPLALIAMYNIVMIMQHIDRLKSGSIYAVEFFNGICLIIIMIVITKMSMRLMKLQREEKRKINE